MVPGTVLSILGILILTTTLWGRGYCHLHFTIRKLRQREIGLFAQKLIARNLDFEKLSKEKNPHFPTLECDWLYLFQTEKFRGWISWSWWGNKISLWISGTCPFMIIWAVYCFTTGWKQPMLALSKSFPVPVGEVRSNLHFSTFCIWRCPPFSDTVTWKQSFT